jgi:ferric-dicitrate binding protein FerR (iron transport regulator)
MKGMKDNYFLAKWLAKEISETELNKYVSEDEIRAYQKIISASNQLKVPSFNADEALEKLKLKDTKTKVRKLNFSKFIYRAAAVIAIIFGSYYFIGNQTQNYTTSFAEKINFDLPDNSTVNLNAASEITFKSSNWKKNRNLSLKGEAYFKVEKGSKFTVKTPVGNVTVLGTQFNVVARANYFEVVCYEGLVSATYKNNSIKIPAGSSFKVLNAKVKFEKTIDESNPSWIQNNSSFKSMPYWYVVNELERQYNITVEFNEIQANKLFTGSFTHNNIETALKAITIPLNLNYTFVTNKKVNLK